MKDFFEIETKQINDRRLQALIKDEGMAGVGTYFYLRCIIAGQSSDGVPVSYVIKTANVRISRIRIRKVLYNYGLFTQDEFGIVRACELEPTYVMRTDGTPTYECMGTHGTGTYGTLTQATHTDGTLTQATHTDGTHTDGRVRTDGLSTHATHTDGI